MNPRVPQPQAVQQQPLTQTQWISLISLAAVQFMNILDFMIVMPLGPRYLQELEITTGQFGNIVASYGFAAFCGGMIAAGFVDRFERKRALLTLFALFSVCTWLCYLAPNYTFLMIGRALTGVFGGVMGSMVMTIVGDLFADARRGFAIGVVTTSFSVASVVGVPLGLWIAEKANSASMTFLSIALLCIPIWVALAYALPTLRSHLDQPKRNYVQSLLRAVQIPSHRLAYMFSVLLVFSTFSVVPYIATYCVRNVKIGGQNLMYVYFFGGISTFISMPIIGKLADRYGKLKVFQIMACLSVVPTLVVTNLPEIPLSWAVLITTIFMVAISGRMVPAQALITNASVPALRAGFMSINSAVQHLASAIAVSVSATLLGESETQTIQNFHIVGLIAITAIISSIAFATQVRPGTNSEPEPATI